MKRFTINILLQGFYAEMRFKRILSISDDSHFLRSSLIRADDNGLSRKTINPRKDIRKDLGNVTTETFNT